MDKNKENQSRNLNMFQPTDTSEEYSPKNRQNLDFNKTKVGLKFLDDAILTLDGDLKSVNPNFADKRKVLDAINKKDYITMRQISDFFFRTNGIYSRLCKYMANLYKYDWFLSAYSNEAKKANSNSNNSKLLSSYYKALTLLDNFNVKSFFSKTMLKVITQGAYYGYVVDGNDKPIVQELPLAYCRSRYESNGLPAVEFNMKFFDDAFKDAKQRIKILELFPKEFAKGYILFKEGKLPAETSNDTAGWYLLDTKRAFKFDIHGSEIPLFMATIPYLIDLDQAQALDRKKMAQKLIKIIIQKLPVDKNGDLVFDIDEATSLHNNAVQMLQKAIGVDVLTTFADVDVADLADKSSVTSVDELEKVERTVFNASGTAQNLFNTDGNIALEKSILNDEASLWNVVLQFENFLNFLIKDFNTNTKKFSLKVQILNTTIYNYKDIAKQYKEFTSMGYSKLLPLIALGQSQSSILANAYFETQVLDLVSLLIPPLTSNTMNSDALKTAKGQNPSEEEKTPGRKEKADDEKSEKTIANQESMN